MYILKLAATCARDSADARCGCFRCIQASSYQLLLCLVGAYGLVLGLTSKDKLG